MDSDTQKYIDDKMNTLVSALNKDIDAIRREQERGEQTFQKNWKEFDEDIKGLRLEFKAIQESLQQVRLSFEGLPNLLVLQLQDFSSKFLKESVDISIKKHHFECMQAATERALGIMQSAEGVKFAKNAIKSCIDNDNCIEESLKKKFIKLTDDKEIQKSLLTVIKTDNDKALGSWFKVNFKQVISPIIIIAALLGIAVMFLYYMNKVNTIISDVKSEAREVKK